MNSYKVTLRYYSGWYKHIYLPAQNQAEAFDKAHGFITQYDGVCEIIPEKISKKYMAEHGLEYSNEDKLREQARNRNAQGYKAEQMKEALEKITEICDVTRPGKNARLWYVRMTEDKLADYSDWDIKRLGLRENYEYIVVAENTGHILYAINVSGNSVMQSIAELTNLLARKGW